MANNKQVGILRRWWPAIAWMTMIFALSSMPSVPEVRKLHLSDKVLHGIGYAILSLLVWRALDHKKLGWVRVAAVVLICATYGYSDEIHQRFVPGRTYDLLDLAADTIGASTTAIGVLVAEIWKGRKGNRL